MMYLIKKGRLRGGGRAGRKDPHFGEPLLLDVFERSRGCYTEANEKYIGLRIG
jgi:hypothetical protein